MSRESLDTRDTSREADADRAIAGFTYPLDDQDMAKIEQKMRDSWYNDNALVKFWGKIEKSILTSFSLGDGTRLLKGLIRRDQLITCRSLIPFIMAGWLSAEDAKNIDFIQHWSLTILKNRPSVLSPPVAKDVDRDAPARETIRIRGSILSIPPAPKKGEIWLKELVQKAEGLLPKLRNIEKRVTRRDDIKLLYKVTDPNQSMRDAKDPNKISPVSIPPGNKFVAGYA